MRIFRKKRQNCFVGGINVLRVPAEGGPAERPFALAEERANVGRDKAGVAKSILHAGVEGALAQVVAIVKHNRATLLEGYHGRAVAGH